MAKRRLIRRKLVRVEAGGNPQAAPVKSVPAPKPEVKEDESSPPSRVDLVLKRARGTVSAPPSESEPAPKPTVVPKVVKETVTEEPWPWPPPGQVELICLRPSLRNETGRVTGKKYSFEGGEPVLVDERDAGYLKATTRGSRSCCGGRGETRVFVEPGEL